MVSINSLTGALVGAAGNLQNTSSQISDTIATIVTGNSNPQDVAATSLAAVLKSQTSALNVASGNIAQSVSLAQTASQGISQELNIVSQLQQLQAQANNGALSNQELQGLDQQFQSLARELDQIGNGTAFNGVSLLNGTYSTNIDQALGSNTGNSDLSLSIPDLTSSGLFNGATPNLLSQANTQSAASVLDTASQTLQAAQANVGSFSQALDVAAASVESAQFNLMAANSGTDFTEEATNLSQLNLQQNAQIALQAQANNIPASVLGLLNQPPV